MDRLGEIHRGAATPHGALGNLRRCLSWGVLGPVLDGSGRQGAVTSASVTTLFLNRRSSSSSDEHLGLRLRKALESGTHPAPHTFGQSYLGWG